MYITLRNQKILVQCMFQHVWHSQSKEIYGGFPKRSSKSSILTGLSNRLSSYWGTPMVEPFMEIQHGIIHHGTPFHEIDFPSWNPMVEPLHGVTPPYFSRLPGTFSAPMVFSVACARETCALSTRSLHTGGPSQLLIIGGGIYVAGIRSDTVITIVI